MEKRLINAIKALQKVLPEYAELDDEGRKAIRHAVYSNCGRGPLVERIFTEVFVCGSEVLSVESQSFVS